MLALLLQALVPVGASGQPAIVREDSIPTPPAEPLGTIQGPAQVCIGDTGFYTMDAPVGAACEWIVDGAVQVTENCELEMIWTTSGEHLIILIFNYSNGSSYVMDSLEVYVDFFPDVELGNDTTILQGQSLTLDAGNQGAEYLWNTGATTRTIDVTTAGTYSATVTTTCGDDFDEIEVSVIVAVDEMHQLPFDYTVQDQTLHIINGEPAGIIEIYNISGSLVSRVKKSRVVKLPGIGLYIARIFYEKTAYTIKLAVL
jgi:hypothetical protein